MKTADLHGLRGAFQQIIGTIALVCACAVASPAQDLSKAKPPSPVALTALPEAAAVADGKLNATIPLTVPSGTPIQVALDQEVRIKKVGQSIHGRVVEPVYAFDKLVVPVGSEAVGAITKIEDVSKGKRTLAALDADFTPPHKIDLEFNELILPDGKHIPVQTTVTPGSGQVIQFVTAPDAEKRKGVKGAAGERVKEAKERAKQEWDAAMKQVHEPDKFHRLERYLVAQLPAHPHYLDAGSVYFAELKQPLDFGTEQLTPEAGASLGSAPPGSVVRARLVTPLSSATTQKGAEVDALVSQPLFDGDKLVIPQGSHIKGSVVQVRPAGGRKRNGQLRIVFHQFALPDGVAQNVEASLEGVQAAESDHLELDSEGGAQTTSPKTRYLMSGIAVGLAAIASNGDGDEATNRSAGGAGGYKLIGMAMSAAIRSQAVGMGLGVFGASRSVYARFVARGREVEFRKNTAMEIGFGAPIAPAPKPTPTQQ